jgi:hypothetical protein
MKSIIFWDMTPCSPLSFKRRFGGTYRLHLQGGINKFSLPPACLLVFAVLIYSTLKMEAICSSETSIETQRTTRRHIPEDDTLQISYLLYYITVAYFRSRFSSCNFLVVLKMEIKKYICGASPKETYFILTFTNTYQKYIICFFLSVQNLMKISIKLLIPQMSPVAERLVALQQGCCPSRLMWRYCFTLVFPRC